MPRAKKQHLTRQKDGKFYCKYHEVMFVGRTEDEAFAKREEYKIAEKRREAVRQNPTVAEYADSWLPVAKAGAKPKTVAMCKSNLVHLKSCIGDRFVRDVRPSDIKAVYSTCYLTASAEYIKHARATFRELFAAAVEDGIIQTNPVTADTAKPHRGTTGGHRAITPEERTLIETVAIDNPMHTAAIIMLYAGLRPQEIKALRMEDIDEQAGVIHVRHFVHTTPDYKYIESKSGKTEKAARDVPLFPPVIEAVRGKTGLILSNGKHLATVSQWQNAWNTYCHQIERHINGTTRGWYGRKKEHRLAGDSLPPWKSFTVRPYDLRHSFASWCRDNGVELHTCVEWMGHTDATMILKIYDEVSSARSKTEADKLRKSVFGLSNGLSAETGKP